MNRYGASKGNLHAVRHRPGAGQGLAVFVVSGVDHNFPEAETENKRAAQATNLPFHNTLNIISSSDYSLYYRHYLYLHRYCYKIHTSASCPLSSISPLEACKSVLLTYSKFCAQPTVHC